jgi:hypothetical protein
MQMYRRMGGQTDMKNRIVDFRNFVNVSKNDQVNEYGIISQISKQI